MVIRPRHDPPYEAEPVPHWWPTDGTVFLIQGKWNRLFPQLVKLFGGDRRRAAICVLQMIFHPEDFK